MPKKRAKEKMRREEMKGREKRRNTQPSKWWKDELFLLNFFELKLSPFSSSSCFAVRKKREREAKKKTPREWDKTEKQRWKMCDKESDVSLLHVFIPDWCQKEKRKRKHSAMVKLVPLFFLFFLLSFAVQQWRRRRKTGKRRKRRRKWHCYLLCNVTLNN